MQMKLLILSFVAVILVSYFAVSALPSANALTTRTDFSDRHSSASYGNSHICGDHICKPGEQTEWQTKMWAAQRGGMENLQLHNNAKLHGEDVMHNLQGTTTGPTTMHGNIKMNDKMSMSGNMTDNGTSPTGTK